MVKASKPKSSESTSKKTASDKASEEKKAAAPRKPKVSAKEEAPPPAPAAAPGLQPSSTIAGPGSDSVMDKPSTSATKAPRFASKPPRNPFVGAKNPRLRDRDR